MLHKKKKGGDLPDEGEEGFDQATSPYGEDDQNIGYFAAMEHVCALFIVTDSPTYVNFNFSQ